MQTEALLPPLDCRCGSQPEPLPALGRAARARAGSPSKDTKQPDAEHARDDERGAPGGAAPVTFEGSCAPVSDAFAPKAIFQGYSKLAQRGTIKGLLSLERTERTDSHRREEQETTPRRTKPARPGDPLRRSPVKVARPQPTKTCRQKASSQKLDSNSHRQTPPLENLFSGRLRAHFGLGFSVKPFCAGCPRLCPFRLLWPFSQKCLLAQRNLYCSSSLSENWRPAAGCNRALPCSNRLGARRCGFCARSSASGALACENAAPEAFDSAQPRSRSTARFSLALVMVAA